MKKKRYLWYIIIALVAVIGISVAYKIITKEPEPEFVFTYAENQSEGYPTTKGAYYFAKRVHEETNGRIQILVYPNAELGREAEVIEQMRYGGIDFARISLSQLAEIDSKLNILQMPYLYNSAEHMWNVLKSSIGDSFLEEVGTVDLVGLSWYESGTRSFYTVRQLNRIEDMKGMKIRVQQSDLMVDMIKCLGAEAVPLSYEEVYSALEFGSIDGAENNWPSYEDTGHYKVAKYLFEDEHTRVPEMQLCSTHTFSLLSEEDREIIYRCARESADYERNLWNERVNESRERAVEAGTVIVEVPASQKQLLREQMSPVYEKYCSEYMDIVNAILDYKQND